jgi:hypothetical protein
MSTSGERLIDSSAASCFGLDSNSGGGTLGESLLTYPCRLPVGPHNRAPQANP